jgi:dimethylamine--corrinoid protein Co-methyltransferase
MAKYLTRRGDGALIEMTSEEIMSDLEAGTADAADKGKIAPLSKDDLDMLLDIFTNPTRFVSVEPGNEVVVTHDIGTLRVMGDQGNSGVGIPLSRVQGASRSMKGHFVPTPWSWDTSIIALNR